jgi:hypothetical protein
VRRPLLPLAAIARAAAHVARGSAPSDRNHLALAINELLGAAALDASVAAESGGMSWQAAMTTLDGPGWTAHRAKNAELASELRARLPIETIARR